MKCVRDTGWDRYWSHWDKICQEYRKNRWKAESCFFTRRGRMCERALKTMYDHGYHHEYYLARYRAMMRSEYTEHKKWQ